MKKDLPQPILKTMKREDVARMSVTNSPKLPSTIVTEDGEVKQWVGIGWIKLDRKPQKGDVQLV